MVGVPGPQIVYVLILPAYFCAALSWLIAGGLMCWTTGQGRVRPLALGTATALLAFVPGNLLVWAAALGVFGYERIDDGRYLPWFFLALALCNLLLLAFSLHLPYRKRRTSA